ncbi:sister chromatid cohesion protein Eso1 [Cucurbitaria berberidis CBS 394.84]|uniref:Sister chromatid cohesion protein Eso1 n=1 Tax=Cucurbitaria berberidis CBS 394.84 TaxID=1168544 RepID=A0A9P4L6A6_9PLEO|nr:sister chromatid cohesion protein Eso1 [Cucurbitaria berberidis CBS 394.84]KAF1843756.1 sister chromatid cohesion protein Eso1 [Cucurbitaria berberidis CBS 394.84]
MPGKWTHRLDSCWSLARRSSQVLYRRSSTHVPGRILRGDSLGPVRDDAHQTFRVRKDGTAKELPLPPSLDPIVLEKRSSWEQAKRQPKFADFTPFQKKLWENPFAHSLASPLRQCRATLISLPVAFLTSLHARPHPTTSDPWLLPVSLTTDKKHLGPPHRFLGRQLVAAQQGKKKAWEKSLHIRLIEKLGSNSTRRMVWREDMAEFVLDMMRKRLVTKLSWNFGFRGRLTPVSSPRTEDIENIEDVSCVLLFGSLRTRADGLQDRADQIKVELEKWSNYFSKSLTTKLDPHASSEVTHTSPVWYTEPLVPRLQPRLQYPELEFKSTIWCGRKVAVYSLTDLLGEEKAKALIKGSKYDGEKCVVLKRARHNRMLATLPPKTPPHSFLSRWPSFSHLSKLHLVKPSRTSVNPTSAVCEFTFVPGMRPIPPITASGHERSQIPKWTYSRQAKRALYDEEPPTKRRRVETAYESSAIHATTIATCPSPMESSSPTRDGSVPPTSSPKDLAAIFSDELLQSSPRSSSAPRSSPPALQKRRPFFSFLKKQSVPKTPTKHPLVERSHNAHSPPKQPPKKKRMVQMQLDLATAHRKTCKACGMEYIPSNAEDAAMHRKFHAMNLGGVDFTRPVIERFRKNQVWSGGDGSFITVVGRKDALVLRNRASDVLKVVNTELAAVPISDEEMWSQTGSTSFANAPKETTASNADASATDESGSPLVDRFKMYLYIRGNKCVGACLVERIWEAYTVLDQKVASKQACQLPAAHQSSSISISTESDSAILGISRIWTSSQHRKQGIATRLLESARCGFLYGFKIEKERVAFSQPTESGGNLARRWFGSTAGWHVYMD